MIADRTGHRSLPFWIRANNRLSLELRRSVMYQCQNGVILVDVTPASFAEQVTRFHRAALAAYRYASYDPDHMAELIAEANGERLTPVDLGMTLNAAAVDVADRPEPSRATVEKQTELSTFSWVNKFDNEGIKAFATVSDADDATTLTLIADTQYLDPPFIESGLRGMESLVTSQALSAEAR
jgi:hypothetical protein